MSTCCPRQHVDIIASDLPSEWGATGSAEVLDDPLDAAGQGGDVVRLDGGEHADAQLVAAQLAVRLDIDDVVGAQRLRDLGGIHLFVEVDGADHLRK